MSVARKPRRIGPPEPPPPPEPGAVEAEFSLEAFLQDLSAGELMDLDDATGGAVSRLSAGREEPVTLRLLVAIAWIARRRREPRLTFAQVREMKADELAGVLNAIEVGGGPKAPSAPA